MLYNILILFSYFCWKHLGLRAPPVLILPVQPPGATGLCPSNAAAELDAKGPQPCPVLGPAELGSPAGPCPSPGRWAVPSVPWQCPVCPGSAPVCPGSATVCPGLPAPGWGWDGPQLSGHPRGALCSCWALPCSLGESGLYCSTVIVNMPLSFFLCNISF